MATLISLTANNPSNEGYWYSPMKQGFYRLPFQISFFKWDTLHLVTRHPHKVSTKGYFAPLTWTSWFYYGIVASIIKAIPFKYEALKLSKASKYFNLLSVFVLFTFLTFFSQDLRSSTIEPWYERLPIELSQVNWRSQSLVNVGSAPFMHYLQLWNINIMKSYYDLEKFESLQQENVFDSVHAMENMAVNPNYFMVVEKESYESDVLWLHHFGLKGKLSDGQWEWRMSPKVSGFIMEGVIFPKYKTFSEPLCLFIMKLLVSKNQVNQILSTC